MADELLQRRLPSQRYENALCFALAVSKLVLNHLQLGLPDLCLTSVRRSCFYILRSAGNYGLYRNTY